MFPIFVFGQYTSIPSPVFEQRLIDLGYDTIHDGQVFTVNISAVTYLSVFNHNIVDLTGIADFTALEVLDCDFSRLTSLDVSQNTALKELYCANNLLTNLDISQNTTLIELSCGYNQLTNLDVSQNTALKELYCDYNQLTNLDISQNTALIELSCGFNQLTNLDVSQNTALKGLSCANDGSLSGLANLDVSQNTSLESLFCVGNQLTSLDVSQNTALIYLSCVYNQLTSIDLSQNISLYALNCMNNQLTSLDLRRNGPYLLHINSTDNDSLFCISVDDSTWYTNNSYNIDSHTNFSNDCNSTLANTNVFKNSSISIYPNPTKENITININNFNGNINTEVYDLIGNRLQVTNETTISLRDYSKGIYILKVAYGDRVKEVKVIKD